MKANNPTIKKMLIGMSLLACSALPATSQASLNLFQSYTGNVAMSSDGFGSLSNTGTISASVPAGSTVVAAYLYSSTFFTTGTPSVSLGGSAVSFGPRVANGTACCDLASFRADVTSIVSPTINGGAGGVYNFNVTETGLGNNTDGEALVVIYENAALPNATVGILDGFASVTGDSANINFANALDPNDPGFFAEMILGIGFSCCNQRSRVDVNGVLMTENAGNNDDSTDIGEANGNLITVGSFDDAYSPANPDYASDSEKYDLSPFVSAGDTSINIRTSNASQDDNIFLAGFYVDGEATIVTTPEPGILALMGLGLLGVISAGRTRRRS